MFRRTWWTRRRKVYGGIAVVLLLASGVWVSGTHELHVGQPLDEAKAVLWRAGARDCSDGCGMYPQCHGREPGNIERTYHQFPNGHTIYVEADRDYETQPFRVRYFIRYRGWYKTGLRSTETLPPTDSVTLRRSVFAFLPGWEYVVAIWN